ncbi:DUF3488 and transglutaminase-like domain-containing protein [Demequina capsici]|uniref:DUF3488 and transglutaminase-like domain-containing protein n=1 Tax=Demequina capsici TaxID=3075620 RepID=A0AA96JBZ1_9MICO|nr:DUF3488 and transglutaminase-like domain-containing protein [Demequina sp. PMTSA13]WNM26236.1 DUF3488 and transglutaminase-like domain-containing protein [Demequina sp. PMTSA13]
MRGSQHVPWGATPLIAGASVAGLLAFSTPVELGAWLTGPLLLLSVVVAVVLAARLITRSRMIPTAAGLAVALVAAVPMHTNSPLPTPAALRALLDAVREGITYTMTSAAPVTDTAPLTALVSVGIVLLFLVAEHLSVSWRATGAAGALLLLPWLPAAVVPWAVPWTGVAAAVVLWLGALALTSAHDDVPVPPRVLSWLPATAAVIGVSALVAPLLVGVPGWGSLPQLRTGGDAATRLDLGLDLRESLTSRSQSTVLTYTTSDGSPVDVLRLYTAEDFTGSSWQRNPSGTASETTSGWILWPQQEFVTQEPAQTIEISVDTLTESALPLTVDPRRAYVSNLWQYDSVDDEVRSTETDTAGMDYTLVSDPGYVTPGRLANASGEDQVDAAALTVPAAVDAARIGAVAREIVADAGATNRYEQALAIQAWLRDPAEFTYTTAVALSGDDAVSEFLDTREGYCVQFATTMVVMARLLGIPARIGIGFLGGKQSPDGGFEVIGGNAHAWPELYFPGTGWVRFEPTPAVQATAPAYANTDSGATAAPTASPSPSPSTSSEPTDSATPSSSPSTTASTDPTTGGGRTGGTTLLLWLALVAAAAALGLGAWGWRSAGRRTTSFAKGAEAAWDRLRTRLPERARWPLSATPSEAAAHVRSTVRLADAADDALTELTDAITAARYAPSHQADHDASPQVQHLKSLADAIASSARHDRGR